MTTSPSSLCAKDYNADNRITPQNITTAQLHAQRCQAHHGDGSLAAAIRGAMDGRRLGDNATVALTVEEQLRGGEPWAQSRSRS